MTHDRASDVRVFDQADDLAGALVAIHADEMAARGERPLSIALTGGSAAKLYGALVAAPLAWARVHVWFGDERSVAPDHADSNYRGAREALLSKVDLPEANVHRVRGEADPDDAARAYEIELRAVTGDGALDIVHLGMGPDGHVCSLFPGHPLLSERTRLVAALRDSPKPPPSRVTLTLEALALARRALFLVLGDGKADAVRAAIEDPASDLPAARVHRMGRATWLLDRGAASKLRPESVSNPSFR